MWVLHLREREIAVKTGMAMIDETAEDADAAVSAVVDKLTGGREGARRGQDHPVRLRRANIVDDAIEHDADVIVMGSRGRSDLAGFILGSTAHKVIHLTDRPVLIVR